MHEDKLSDRMKTGEDRIVRNGHMITYRFTVFMFHCISTSWSLDQDTQNGFCSRVVLATDSALITMQLLATWVSDKAEETAVTVFHLVLVLELVA